MFEYKVTLIRSFVVISWFFCIDLFIYDCQQFQNAIKVSILHCALLEFCNQMRDFNFQNTQTAITIFFTQYLLAIGLLIAPIIGMPLYIINHGIWPYIEQYVLFFALVYLLFFIELYIVLKNPNPRTYLKYAWDDFRASKNAKKIKKKKK